jgi:hypothetical protein
MRLRAQAGGKSARGPGTIAHSASTRVSIPARVYGPNSISVLD